MDIGRKSALAYDLALPHPAPSAMLTFPAHDPLDAHLPSRQANIGLNISLLR